MPFHGTVVAGALLIGSTALGQPARTRIEPVVPPPLTRPAAEVRRDQLPKGATGAMPERDGEPFHVNLPGGDPRVTSEGVRRTVEQVLRALGWRGSSQELRLIGEEAQVTTFQQTCGGVPIEYARVHAVVQPGRGLAAVTGHVFARVQPSNRARISAARAVAVARAHAAKRTAVKARETPKPELVLLPYADSMKYAWRVEVAAEEGSYRFWIDAETRRILQLEPLFSPGS